MASTFIGMGANKEVQDTESLKKENVELAKANEKAEKEKATLQEELAKANEKIAQLEAKKQNKK